MRASISTPAVAYNGSAAMPARDRTGDRCPYWWLTGAGGRRGHYTRAMLFSQIARRWIGSLAALALVAGPIVPAAAHVLAPGAVGPWADVCIAGDPEGAGVRPYKREKPTPLSTLSKHCALCSFCASPAAPPRALAHSEAPTARLQARPVHVRAAPGAAPEWLRIPQRAPPIV